MFDAGNWPNWVQNLRLVGAFLLTAGFGIHAYLQHRAEANEAVSARRWMYWLYAAVFALAAVANFTKLCVTITFGNYERSSFHLGFSTLLLVVSYMALLAGVRRSR